ncbi:hypothetical protein QTH87_04730 [Variovorax sp. J22P168]|uniref:CIS tube protein n=1 Tax=Variovorax jilinensis TaxID=3053513 RepID=UPI0025776BA6|nr:hypothetical protein [Variovorax sp. J22P168]MDM0011737.1 hypothetical protein [Variovorax sp. J22P168]
MARLPDAPSVASATFEVIEGPGAGGGAVAVQFNPVSLEYTIANEFDDRNGNNGARQFVKKSTARLSMTLVYDSTDDGSDVRIQTETISGLMEPARDGRKKYAPKVEFGWGTYSFKGVIEQYKETIDFFAASGVPLRASIALTLAAQEVEFQSSKNPDASVDGSLSPDPVDLPPGAAPAAVANALGDPRAARAIASANASASLRFGAGASLSVGGAVGIGAPVAFSAGAAGGAGAGIGLSFGASGSLGIGATAGAAFAGLRAGSGGRALAVDSAAARAALLPAAGTSGAVSFGPGGRATASGGASLSADVGAGADLHARIGFGGA